MTKTCPVCQEVVEEKEDYCSICGADLDYCEVPEKEETEE